MRVQRVCLSTFTEDSKTGLHNLLLTLIDYTTTICDGFRQETTRVVVARSITVKRCEPAFFWVQIPKGKLFQCLIYPSRDMTTEQREITEACPPVRS